MESALLFFHSIDLEYFCIFALCGKKKSGATVISGGFGLGNITGVKWWPSQCTILHHIFPPPFICSFFFTVISSLSPPSLPPSHFCDICTPNPLPHFPFHHFALLLVFLYGGGGDGTGPVIYAWPPLNKQCELALVAGGDAGCRGGLAAVLVAITAVVAEQEAGRMISSW